MKIMRPIFKTKMLIYQLKANLDEKFLFGKITHHLDPEIRELLVKGHIWDKELHILFWSMIYLLLKLKSYF